MGGQTLVRVRIVVAAIFDLMTVEDWRVEIVNLRVGARVREGKGGGGGEGKKKICLPDIIVLLGNSVRPQTELLIGAA